MVPFDDSARYGVMVNRGTGSGCWSWLRSHDDVKPCSVLGPHRSHLSLTICTECRVNG